MPPFLHSYQVFLPKKKKIKLELDHASHLLYHFAGNVRRRETCAVHHEEANSKIQDVGNLIRTNDLVVWNKLPKEKEKEKRDVEFIDQKRLKRTINQMYCGHCLNPDSSKV